MSISLRRVSGRDILSGVFRYLETSSDWTLRLMQPEENPLTPQKILNAEKENIVGVFFTEAGSPELMRALSETDLPIAAIGIKSSLLQSRKGRTIFVLNDNAGIGIMGASSTRSASCRHTSVRIG